MFDAEKQIHNLRKELHELRNRFVELKHEYEIEKGRRISAEQALQPRIWDARLHFDKYS